MKYFRSSLAIASSFSIAFFYHKSLPFYDSLCKESKTFFCINTNDIKEDIVVQFMRIILYDLNIMCESLKISDEEDTPINKEVKIYVSNIGKILDTIQKLFKIC